MRYKILWAKKAEQLEDSVSVFLSKGWELNGTLVVGNFCLYQAVTKKEAGDD